MRAAIKSTEGAEATAALVARGNRGAVSGVRLEDSIGSEVYSNSRCTLSQARGDIIEYLDEYNTKLQHTSIADQTPDQAYWSLLPAILAAT